MKTAIAIAALLSVAYSQRQPTLDVISRFKEATPQYLNSTERLEEELAKARVTAAKETEIYHTKIITVHKTFVQDAMDLTQSMQLQLTHQNRTVDQTCLGFLNESVEVNLELAGVGNTNCMIFQNARFVTINEQFYTTIKNIESYISGWHLVDLFRGKNVFYKPSMITDSLDERLRMAENGPRDASQQLNKSLETLRANMKTLHSGYVKCMAAMRTVLMGDIEITLAELRTICLGDLVKTLPKIVGEVV